MANLKTKKKTSSKKKTTSSSLRLSKDEKDLINNFRKCNPLEKIIVMAIASKASKGISDRTIDIQSLIG